ncbi:MAG: dethiobiotin synthase [Actinomycetota bacterium]|nr:dethiobiotin synthase [Actinomycetota bacterium]
MPPAPRQALPGVFVTGTGTGVGKTFVGAALAALLRERDVDVGVMKPAETGVEEPTAPCYSVDAARLAAAAGVGDPPELVVPYKLRDPLAPSVAAGREGREVSVEVVMAAYHELRRRHAFLLVEGAGGIAVPFGGGVDMAGLAEAMHLPLLVVAPTGLGTINHAVLTIEYARARGLVVLGTLLNLRADPPDLAERTNPAVLARLTGLPVYGPIDELRPGPPDDRAAVEAVRSSCPAFVEALVEGKG